MTVEDLVKEIMALSVEDRARLRLHLGVVELIANNMRGNYLARFEVETESYGKIEGTLFFAPLLQEVCRRFQQKAFPQDETGKKVNDGPTVVATGDGDGGIIAQVVNGPVDGGVLSAVEFMTFNMLSDSTQYEEFFQDALKRLAALIEDKVTRKLENTNYLGPNHIETRTLGYAESPKKRRDNTWRPPLTDDQKLSAGRPSGKAKFERELKTAIQSLRKKGIKVTQERIIEPLEYKDVRSLTKRLEAYGLDWNEIKNRY